MLLQLLHYHLDGFLELRVAAGAPRCGFEIDFDVGRNTLVFHFPVAVEAVDSGARCGDSASVDEFGIAADAYEAAPSFLANERAEAGFTEVPRQSIATGAGHFVDD